MDIPPEVRAEWHERHGLSGAALRLLDGCADPGDAHPILTAIEDLRAGEATYVPAT
jgi:hypothetical protein